MLFEAGGLGAAVSEESMRRLQYCLQWLQVSYLFLEPKRAQNICNYSTQRTTLMLKSWFLETLWLRYRPWQPVQGRWCPNTT